MGGEVKDPIVVQSSIALLQERFRQLQRLKEMREEKELRRLLYEPSNKLFKVPETPNHEPSRVFFEPDLGLPLSSAASPPPQLSLSLWPCSRGSSGSCLRSTDARVFVSSRFSGTQSLRANLSDKAEDFDDVDTSLHL